MWNYASEKDPSLNNIYLPMGIAEDRLDFKLTKDMPYLALRSECPL